MKAITLQLPDTLDHQLTLFVRKQKGIRKSAVIRQAVEQYLLMAPENPSCAVAAKKWAGIVTGSARLASGAGYLSDFGRT